MRLSAAVSDYLYTKELTPKSKTWYSQKLRAFVAWSSKHTCETHSTGMLETEQIDTRLIREFLAYLRETPSTAINHKGTPPGSQTLHGYARALKAFLRWCAQDELVPEKLTRRIEMPKREQRIISVFTKQQIDSLFVACAEDVDPKYPWLVERDKAILSILLDTGMRASELCGLALDNLHIERDDPYIIVLGKGRKERELPLGTKARQRLYRYVWRSRPQTESRRVFIGRDRQPLEYKGLCAVLYRLKRKADISGVRCTPHDFRHTFSFNYIDNGGDVARLSRLLGHTDIAVTANYLRAFSSREARRGYVSVLDNL